MVYMVLRWINGSYLFVVSAMLIGLWVIHSESEHDGLQRSGVNYDVVCLQQYVLP